jgi:hypothetical protein
MGHLFKGLRISQNSRHYWMLYWKKGRRRNEIDLPGFGTDSDRRTRG